MINSGNKELSQTSTVLDVYFIIKAKPRNLFNFINSYFMIFTLNTIHRMYQTFFIQRNIFAFIMTTPVSSLIFPMTKLFEPL